MKQHIERLVDDLTGGDASETLTYVVDGQGFEMDLNDDNARAFRDAVAPWVAVSRPISGAAVTVATATRRASSSRPRSDDSAAIREWARRNGHAVNERGRIPKDVREAYTAAQSAGATA